MKNFIYILLAGLAAAGLASCDKQDLKRSIADEIYSAEIEEDTLQTKGSSDDIVEGGKKTFFATLRKSSDGGNTWTYVSHSNWEWDAPSNCSIDSQNNNDSRHGVTAGSVVIVGGSAGTSSLTANANGTPSGNLSKGVSVTVVSKPKADVRIVNQIDDEWGKSDGKSSGDRYKVWYYNLLNYSSFEGTVYVKYKFKNNANAPEVTQEGTYTVPANGRKTLVGVQDANGGYFEKLAFEIR